MNVQNNIIGMEDAPTGRAVANVIIEDLKRLAEKHHRPNGTEWPGTAETEAFERLSMRCARHMLSEVLNSEAMKVVDAVLACDMAERTSVWGAKTDYETPTANLMYAAEGFSNYTCEVVQQQMDAVQ